MPNVKRIAFALAAAAATLSVADYLAWRTSHTRLTALAAESGLSRRRLEIATELLRETVPARAAAKLAWSLLDLEVDRGWLNELPPDERTVESRRGLERLRLARELAEEVLAHHPASWQAATTLGASRYLEAQRRRQQDQPISAWREPLNVAMRLAPGYPEPPIFLASAYLSRWSSLSPRERQELQPVLSRALEDARGLKILIPAWVRLAPSLRRLLEPIPDRPAAWEELGREFLRQGDLERFGIAHRRRLDALPADLADRVDRGRARLRGGHPRAGVGLLRSVLSAPPDLAYADSFSAALAALPEGSELGRTSRDLERWLQWTLDLCLVRSCPLEGETLARLAGHLEGLDGAAAGLAALAAGDLAAAGKLEPGAGEESEPEWNRYWIFKAERLAGSDPKEARRSLARVSRRRQDEMLYWRAAERLADTTGESEALERARRELSLLAGAHRSAENWSRRGSVYRLDLLTTQPYGGLRLQLERIPTEGAAIELHWDGRAIGVAALQPGEDLLWRLPVTPGAHLIEVANLTGRALGPAALSLLPASPAD